MRIYIDERKAGAVKLHQKAKIRLRSQSKKLFDGYVARIEPKSDPVTEERVVDIACAKVPKPFFLNEQAEATIYVGKLKNVVIIPAKVLIHGGVWVYKNGKVHFQKVKVLATKNDKVAVDGLKAGTKILIPDLHKKPLSEGTKVFL